MADLDKIVEELSTLSVLEAAELSKKLEEHWGVSASAPVAVAAAAESAPQEEQTDFEVMLTSAGSSKINVIKLVREVTGLGLKEAKDLVDNLPKPVKSALPKEDAEKLKAKFEEAGASVELK